MVKHTGRVEKINAKSRINLMHNNHTQITKHAAVAVLNKIDSATEPLALFANGCGGYSLTKVTTQAFRQRLAKYPDTFVGVFDINATLSYLEDELAECGVK